MAAVGARSAEEQSPADRPALQCREAGERLNWIRFELATAADAPLWFITALEDGKANYEFDWRAALGGAESGGGNVDEDTFSCDKWRAR